jgi:hypothetical protein
VRAKSRPRFGSSASGPFSRGLAGTGGGGGRLRWRAFMGRGRDSGFPEPPAQIPAGGTTAPGSYLE